MIFNEANPKDENLDFLYATARGEGLADNLRKMPSETAFQELNLPFKIIGVNFGDAELWTTEAAARIIRERAEKSARIQLKGFLDKFENTPDWGADNQGDRDKLLGEIRTCLETLGVANLNYNQIIVEAKKALCN
jgi:hypothetical protein